MVEWGKDTLFYPSGPGWTDQKTSKAAAVSMRPHITDQQEKILAFLKRTPAGATYLEISAGAEISAQSVCGRMVELITAKLVDVAKETRPTPSGRKAKVYIIPLETFLK